MQRKVELEKEKKALDDSALEKEIMLQRKLKTIGNYVHDSVPVSNTEVCTIDADSNGATDSEP